MIDLSETITAKSDQLNADDLISGPITIEITEVKKGSAEQPIIISYHGDNGKPYKPSKGMRRVLVGIWGKDGSKFVGRSLTVYNESSVKWAGKEVGGIRISAMSDIKGPVSFPLTVTRGKKEVLLIKPLNVMEDKRSGCLAALEKIGVKITPEIKEEVKKAETKEQLSTIYTKEIKNVK